MAHTYVYQYIHTHKVIVHAYVYARIDFIIFNYNRFSSIFSLTLLIFTSIF